MISSWTVTFVHGVGASHGTPRNHGHASTQDVVSFGAAISACAKAAEWRLALQLLEEVKRRQLDPGC